MSLDRALGGGRLREDMMKKLFVVGCQRSGTTMLQQALTRHSQIVIPPETAFFTHFLGHTRRGQIQHLRRINADLGINLPPPARRVSQPQEAADFFERLAELYVEKAGRPDITYFGEKTPHHLLRLPRILRLFPDANIVLIYRDGRDVALSLTKVPWFSPDLHVGFGYWLRCCRWHRWATEQDSMQLITVKYESLVADPEGQLRAVAAFLGIDFEEAMLQPAEGEPRSSYLDKPWMRRAGQRITSARVGNWRRGLSPEQTRSLEQWGGSQLQWLGYELATRPAKSVPLLFLAKVRWRTFCWRTGNAYRWALKDVLGR